MSSVDRAVLAGHVALVGLGVAFAALAVALAVGAWYARGKYDFEEYVVGACCCGGVSAVLFTLRWVVFG